LAQIDILNGGYVRLVDHMGNDLSACKAARASFNKDAPEMNQSEQRLINFLIREKHMSCFRHSAITYQLKVPLFVARQHFKYQVASAHVEDQNGWNESSRRYITQEPEFHIPANIEWRSAPANKKQGSGEPIDPRIGDVATRDLIAYVDEGVAKYNYYISLGFAPEQARLFLPAYGMFVNYQWTTSLAQVLHFLDEREAHDAQKEIQDVAIAVRRLTEPLFPVTFKALEQGGVIVD
jgi:thymidylate synthase (FAD)